MTKVLVRVIALCFAFMQTQGFAEGVLVFGGTGQLGAYHVRLLAERGESVTVFHRPTSKFKRLEGVEYQRVAGDLMDSDSVAAAMMQVQPRVVIDTSARRGARLQAGEPFYAMAMDNIVKAAVAAGSVEQIIIHSSVGVRASAEPLKRAWGYDIDSDNMRDKAEAEIILENGGVPYTIIRNGLLSFEPAAPTGKARLTEDETVFGVITRTDLTDLALGCMGNPDCLGKIFHAIDDTIERRLPRSEDAES